MQYIVVFSGLVTIILGLITLYQLIKSLRHPIAQWPGAILGVVTVILIVFTVVLANSPLPRGGDVNPTPGTVVPTTTTRQIPSPTPTPTPISPTPTPVATGRGCSYDTSTGWSDWQQYLPDGWYAASGELNGNGNGYQTIPVPNSCKMTSPDYIVKARVKAIHASGFSFGIMVRATSSDNGYLAMAHFYAGDARIYVNTPGPNDFPVASGGGVPSDVYVTYTVTVKGNTITLSLTGGSTIMATDNTYYMPGDVYLRAGIQFSMQSFSVKPL